MKRYLISTLVGLFIIGIIITISYLLYFNTKIAGYIILIIIAIWAAYEIGNEVTGGNY